MAKLLDAWYFQGKSIESVKIAFYLCFNFRSTTAMCWGNCFFVKLMEYVMNFKHCILKTWIVFLKERKADNMG